MEINWKRDGRKMILEHATYVMANYDNYKEELKEVPHFMFLDMAAMYSCISIDEGYSIPISSRSLAEAGMRPDELESIARTNFMREKFTIKRMAEILPYADGDSGLYVLTRERPILGASVIMRPDVLKNTADIAESDLYLLPSSLHEIIAVPESNGDSKERLLSMVKFINARVVDEEDILSDSVYKFDRITWEITKA